MFICLFPGSRVTTGQRVVAKQEIRGFERYPLMWGHGCLLWDFPLAIHTAGFVHVIVLLVAGLALCYGETNNLT
jgi:hypothetical protein